MGTDKDAGSLEKNVNFEFVQGDLCKKEDRERIMKSVEEL